MYQLNLGSDLSFLPGLTWVDKQLTIPFYTFVVLIANLLFWSSVNNIYSAVATFSKTIVRFTNGADCVMQIQIYWDHLNCTLSIKRVAGLLQEGLLIYKQSWVEGGRLAITIWKNAETTRYKSNISLQLFKG